MYDTISLNSVLSVILPDNGCDGQKNWNPYQANHGEQIMSPDILTSWSYFQHHVTFSTGVLPH